MAAFNDELWDSAFSAVKEQFQISSLFREQVEGIKAFIEKSSNVFVTLPTGYGKSLIYQCLLIVADCLNGRPCGTSTLVVISPLQALMKDQVESLQNLGIPAVALIDDVCEDPEILQQVKKWRIYACVWFPRVFTVIKSMEKHFQLLFVSGTFDRRGY